jgi:lactoylglutathione lyase
MEFPERKLTLVFLGYGDEESESAVELTYNWGQDEPYDLGTGYGHIALAAPDIYATCKALEAQGCKIPRPPEPMTKGGRAIAFIEDPDGYTIELIERN